MTPRCMVNDHGADLEFFQNQLSQAGTALLAIATQAPLLVTMGHVAARPMRHAGEA